MDDQRHLTDSTAMAVRVLHLVHWLNRGGIENWLLDLIRAADRNELAMDIVCRGPHKGELAPQVEAAGATVHLCPLGWNYPNFGRRLEALLRSEKYDVLNVHAGSFVGYPCIIGRRAGVAVASTFHNTQFNFEVKHGVRAATDWARGIYTRRSFRTACQKSDAVVSVSRAVMDTVCKVAGVQPDDRFKVLLHGSSMSPTLNNATRIAVRNELNIGPDVPLAIHVGIMRDQKNHLGLMRIADLIRQSMPEFRLILAGDGALRPRIEAEIVRLRLEKTVTLLGLRSDVERLLEASDIMLFPSLWEGFGIAALEAQIKGLPVVGSDIPALLESTAPLQRELLFPVAQEQKMADAVVALLRDPARRKTLGQAASAYMSERYSIAANARAHLEMYRAIVR